MRRSQPPNTSSHVKGYYQSRAGCQKFAPGLAFWRRFWRATGSYWRLRRPPARCHDRRWKAVGAPSPCGCPHAPEPATTARTPTDVDAAARVAGCLVAPEPPIFRKSGRCLETPNADHLDSITFTDCGW